MFLALLQSFSLLTETEIHNAMNPARRYPPSSLASNCIVSLGGSRRRIERPRFFCSRIA